jgi:hypothetical protein
MDDGMFTSQRDSNPFNPIIAGLSETSIRPLVELLIHTINQVDLDASDAVARFSELVRDAFDRHGRERWRVDPLENWTGLGPCQPKIALRLDDGQTGSYVSNADSDDSCSEAGF